MPGSLSVEQMVREILSTLDRGLIDALASGDDPQTFTSGDLVVPANRLSEMIDAPCDRRTPGPATAKMVEAMSRMHENDLMGIAFYFESFGRKLADRVPVLRAFLAEHEPHPS